MKAESTSAREAILDAAAALAADKGVTALGVDQVNKKAGVSKGAFFYHFKTKDEMIRALVAHVSQSFVLGLEAKVSAGMPFTNALIDMTFEEVRRRGSLISSLIAAVYLDRSIGRQIKKRVAAWTERMIKDDHLSPEIAALVRLSLDGVMLSTLIYDSRRDARYFDTVEAAIEGLVRNGLGKSRRRAPRRASLGRNRTVG